MVALRVVREQYERMPDEQLISFAVHESAKLTPESFHLLKDEFERRELDLSVIESAEVDQALHEMDKKSALEESVLRQYVEDVWQYAMEEKARGTGNEEIYTGLVNMRIEPDYAYFIVQSLYSRAKTRVEQAESEINVGWLLLITGLVLLLFIVYGDTSGVFWLGGVTLTGGSVIRLIRSYDVKRKYQAILLIIESEESGC